MQLLELSSTEYVMLTTYKNNGDSIPTVVWVAKDNECLVVSTSKTSGKIKRIRNNSNVTLYETDRSGTEKLSETVEALGYELVDEEQRLSAVSSLKNKYGKIATKIFLTGPMQNRSIIQIRKAI